MANIIINPVSSTQPVGNTLSNDFTGPSGEKLVSDTHGKFYNMNYQKAVFTYNVHAVTVPVVASAMVSVFSFYNPASSGKNMELIRFDLGTVLATTVVDTIGLYYSTGTAAAASTFTTAGTALSCMVGANAYNVCIPYSALTHSGTPTRHMILGDFDAVTSTAANPFSFPFEGTVLVPPGTVISVAMSTAAGTASGLDLGMTWAEVPV